jgi:NagD protein
VTSVDALLFYLRGRHAGKTVLTIAEDEVDRRLRDAGFPVVTDPLHAEMVVVSFDRGFSYRKLHAGFRAVRERGAPIIATNPDPYCPMPDGGLPDCAAMLAALEACTGAKAEAIVGKPSRHMVATVFERLQVDPADTAVVGDRITTDVAMGQAIGAAGILVLTGATSAEDVLSSDVRPDYVLAGIHELIPTQGKGSTE